MSFGIIMNGLLATSELDNWIRYAVLSFVIVFVFLAIVYGVLIIRYQNRRHKQKQLWQKHCKNLKDKQR